MPCDPSHTTQTDERPSLWQNLKRWSCACKFAPIDALLNIYGALTDIALAIREYADAVTQKGYAVSAQHFRIAGGTAVVNGQAIDSILARSAFNYKVVGFGASVLTYPTSAGASANDDVISIRLYDFTAGAYASDTIILTSAQKQGNHTNDGAAIAANITPGHEYGVKIIYTNTDAGAFTMPNVDVFILAEPNELTYQP